MRNHHVFRPLSALAVLCLIGVLALAASATARAGCENIPQLEREVRTGDASAQSLLGYCYSTGKGVPQDTRRAAELYRQAVEQGEPYAMSNLATYYLVGHGGLPRDEHRAAELWRMAAEKGHPGAQYWLGTMYRDGRGGLPRDEQRALNLFRQAAALGVPEAQTELRGRGLSW